MENAPWLDPISARIFATTRWMVIAACRNASEAESREAVAELCQSYWQPVYACIRHHGHSAHDAQDLTQDFFVRLLDGTWLEHLDEAKGRFRTYLSVSLNNFLHDRWRRKWTLRRGRNYKIVSFDGSAAEASYLNTPVTAVTPESLYERQWAEAVLEQALQQLSIELRADGKEALLGHFDQLLGTSNQDFVCVDIAKCLDLKVGALRSVLHRWRHRFRDLVRAEIARTVVSKSEIDDELEHLHRVFARPE